MRGALEGATQAKDASKKDPLSMYECYQERSVLGWRYSGVRTSTRWISEPNIAPRRHVEVEVIRVVTMARPEHDAEDVIPLRKTSGKRV